MAQKLATPYHLLLEREQLLTSGFHAQMTLMACHLCAEVREAQAAIVEAGVGRRADLGEMTLFPRFPPPRGGPRQGVTDTMAWLSRMPYGTLARPGT